MRHAFLSIIIVLLLAGSVLAAVPAPPKAIDAKPEDADKYRDYASQALKENNIPYYKEYTQRAFSAYNDRSLQYRNAGDKTLENAAYKNMADMWVQLADVETRTDGSIDSVRTFLYNAAEHYEKSGALDAGEQALFEFHQSHEKDKYGGVAGDVLASFNPPKQPADKSTPGAEAAKPQTPEQKLAAERAKLEDAAAKARQEMNDAAFALGVNEAEYNRLKALAKESAIDQQALRDAQRAMEDARIRMTAAQENVVRAEGRIKIIELQALQNQHSKETDPAKKAALKSQIDALQKDVDGYETKVAEAQRAAAKARMDALHGRELFFAYLSDFMRGYSEYSGLGGLASLFISDQDLEKQRKAVEDAFCDTLLLGGTQCWSSTICGKETRFAPGSGTAVTETPRGAPRIVAHIEGERSPAAEFNNSREYLYKVTYALSPTEEGDGHYNVVFRRADGSEYHWFTPEQTLSGSVSALATAPILAYSFNDYRAVCLRFSPGIITFDGREVSEICNTIVQQEGTPTRIEAPAPSGGSGGPSGPGGRPPGEGF